MADFWSQYATQGAMRPDSFTGMNEQFRTNLQRMFSDAPPEIAKSLRVKSGYRSPERQAELWAGALKKYGSPAAARKWVAPPGNSQHNKGNASDLSYASEEARKWAHANAANYGLAFPLSNENWHIELAGARGKTHQPWPADPATQPVPTMADAQRHVFDPVQDVMNARAFAPQPEAAKPGLASLYGQPTNVPQVTQAPQAAQMPMDPQSPQTAGATLPGLAVMFMQGQQARRKEREAEAEAEAIRRAALLGANPYQAPNQYT